MKKFIFAVVFLAMLAAAAYWLRSRDSDSDSEYRLVTVERGAVTEVVSATGRLEAVTTVLVGTQVSGIISEIHADFNDRVEPDQVIARIDTRLLELEVAGAEATLLRRRAELQQADRDLNRSSDLFDRALISQSELDLSRLALEIARSDLQSAETNLARAQRDLDYATVRSPISGIVIDRLVDVGQTVAASLQAPELFRIAADLSQMQILAAVDESDIGKIHQQQTVRFRVQAYPDTRFTGIVRQVRLQATSEENVVNYTVAIDVENPDGRLLPGMTATVDFIVADASDVLVVPNSALRFRPTAAMLAALQAQRSARGQSSGPPEPAPADGAPRGARTGALLWYIESGGRVNAIPVRVGVSDGQVTEIESPAIHEGMRVIAGVSGASGQTAVNPFQSRHSGMRRPGGF